VVAYAFVILAVQSSYALVKSESILAWVAPWLQRIGIRDLPPSAAGPSKDTDHYARKRIYLLGFFWTASSLFEELNNASPDLVNDLAVVDFNPQVNMELRRRGITVIYGDISRRATLLHAGIETAEIIISTVPNAILRGTTNQRLVQELREMNPKAKIIAHAELLADVPKLYAAGADFVSLPRLMEAKVLRDVIVAAQENRLEEKRAELEGALRQRQEVLA